MSRLRARNMSRTKQGERGGLKLKDSLVQQRDSGGDPEVRETLFTAVEQCDTAVSQWEMQNYTTCITPRG